jgi:hypothetical protein
MSYFPYTMYNTKKNVLDVQYGKKKRIGRPIRKQYGFRLYNAGQINTVTCLKWVCLIGLKL